MKRTKILYDEYPGDSRWQRFVDTIPKEYFESTTNQELRRVLNDDVDMANVLLYILGDHAETWLKSPIPALDNKSPASLLSEGTSGKRILRSLIMRMP